MGDFELKNNRYYLICYFSWLGYCDSNTGMSESESL